MQCCDHMPFPLKPQIWKSFYYRRWYWIWPDLPPICNYAIYEQPLTSHTSQTVQYISPWTPGSPKRALITNPWSPFSLLSPFTRNIWVKVCSLACFVIFFTFSTIMKCHHASINVKYDCFDFCLRAQMMRDRVKMGYTNCIVVNWEPFKLSIFSKMQTYF